VDVLGAADVTSFWFGDLTDATAGGPAVGRWFTKDPDFDATVLQRFEPLYNAIVAGQHRDWLDTSDTAPAWVIVLDQFSRNMFRGSGKMFAADALAREGVRHAINEGVDTQMPLLRRYFLYMPLMHSEDLADHDLALDRFTSLQDDAESQVPANADFFKGPLKYEHMHRDIVARFGRYPHRNITLGRESTAEELAFLEQPGSSF
jgi:uncharacterized protein (DUF924 family)